MQGRGVTNFSADEPSYGYTTATTEFDDELIRRGIVTTEQAMMAKGASAEQASRLAAEKRGLSQGDNGSVAHRDAKEWNATPNNESAVETEDNDDNGDDDSFEDEDEDEFMQRYRQDRLRQLQSAHDSHSVSVVEHISRADWKVKVNDASMDRWIVVTMVGGAGSRRDHVTQELHRVGREYESSARMPRLLTIEASDAIPNWPPDRVPSMFAYRDGIKCHEWIAPLQGEFPSGDLLGGLFQKWGILLGEDGNNSSSD